MNIKPCFLCGGRNLIWNGQYLCCEDCRKNNIQLIFYADTYFEAIKKWNNRWFDNALLNNLQEAFKYLLDLKLNKGTVHIKGIPYDISYIDSKENYKAIFITKEGQLIGCEYSHYDTIRNLFGINLSEEDVYTLDTICDELLLVRGTCIYKWLSLSLPKKGISTAQINEILRWVSDNKWAERIEVENLMCTPIDLYKCLKGKCYERN